jgi:hypothetical protein
MQDNFRKSSYSAHNGNCVEVGRRTARTCDGGACVETASGGGEVLVRDTQNRNGPVLAVPAVAWRAFTASVKR